MGKEMVGFNDLTKVPATAVAELGPRLGSGSNAWALHHCALLHPALGRNKKGRAGPPEVPSRPPY
jgi:hypothetical protein